MALCVCMVSGWHKKNIRSWARMSIYIYVYIFVTTIALEREQNYNPFIGERKQQVVQDHYK
jgi:hypothetical protein